MFSNGGRSSKKGEQMHMISAKGNQAQRQIKLRDVYALFSKMIILSLVLTRNGRWQQTFYTKLARR